MAREPVGLESLSGAERVESHGKPYALATTDRGMLDVFRIEGGRATAFGGAIDRAAALRIVEGDASGAAQARADRFHAQLDATIASVRSDVSGPVLAAGYEAWHMGGGCMSWGRDLGDGTHLLVCTSDNAIDGDPKAADWIVGRYGSDEGFICIQEPMGLVEAIAAGDAIPVPADANGAAIERAVDSLEEAVAAAAGDGAPAPR